jgi:hypothetical protein
MNLATQQGITKKASQLVKRRIRVTMGQVKLQLQVIGEGEVEETSQRNKSTLNNSASQDGVKQTHLELHCNSK